MAIVLSSSAMMRGALALVLLGVATIAWLEEVGVPRLHGRLSRGFKVIPPSLLFGPEKPAEGEPPEPFVRRAVVSHCPTCTMVLQSSLPYERYDPAHYEIGQAASLSSEIHAWAPFG